jgi:hypothetical protein
MPAIVVAAALTASFACPEHASAGIIAPQHLNFSSDDLAKALQDMGSGSTSSSAPGRRNSPRLPVSEGDQPANPLGLFDSSLPSGGTSTSGSPSGAGAAGAAVSTLSSCLLLQDDLPLERLAVEQGLCLPDPPGTDVLRPPRRVCG